MPTTKILVVDGLTTLKHLRQRPPNVAVVMARGSSKSAADLTSQAEPSIECPARPGTPVRPEACIESLKRADTPEEFSVVAIGTSTGGPAALGKLVPALPADLGIPVLIVQHMPPGFTRSLAAQLNARSGLEVKEAEQDDPVVAGTVFIAPGGRHMEVVNRSGRMSIHLHDEAQVRNCRPSVDVLFESLASAADLPVLTVVMTGMGKDGSTGVAKLAGRGSYNLTQDAESCVVYGMPRVVAELGLSHEVVPLAKLANRIRDLSIRSGRA